MDPWGDTAHSGSVAPPSWTQPQGPVRVVRPAPLLPDGQPPTQAALRWRLRAASVDYLIVYVAYLWLCHSLHWQVADIRHLVFLTLAVAAYHFVLESFGGQTIGKAWMGLRVVSVDGKPASAKAVAIRSALRVIDQFPVCYMSGLISLLRTGPERRQRLGDVAAGTKVIAVGGRAARRGTPGWMLPTYTVIAAAVTLLMFYGLSKAQPPLTSTQTAQFIAGCQETIGAANVDCGCLLKHLEAEGYVSMNSLHDLMLRVSSEETNSQFGPARETLYAATVACPR